MRRITLQLPFLLALLLFCACNPTRRLSPGETLFDGATIKVEGVNKKTRKALASELKALVRPAHNTKVLGIRYKLAFYNIFDTVSGKGIRNWVKNTLGEPPVVTSQFNLEKNRQVLQNRLENDGYFHATVTGDTSTKRRITRATFQTTPGPQYMIRNIYWPDTLTEVEREVGATRDLSLLKSGKPYNLTTVKNERIRIDLALKDKGYFYFNPEYILMVIDSTAGNYEVDVYVTIKPNAPENALYPYKINNIWVYADYSIEKDSLLATVPSENFEGYNIIQSEPLFRNKMFARTLVFKPYDTYSRADHNKSLSRLVNLGVYRFVKARFEEVDTPGHYLDPYYFLTPLPKKSWRAEVTGLTKSNNSTGSELTLSWRNRNFFKAAELFSISGYYGIESQVSGNFRVATNRFGTDINLYVPRILGFWTFARHSQYVPRTRINLAYEFFNRTSEYTLQSFRGSYGFTWKPTIDVEHQLNVLSANYVLPTNIQPAFQQRLDTDIVLARSIQRQFILGPNYNFNYNSLAKPNDNQHNFYLNYNIDLPGNILGLVSGATFHEEKQGTLQVFKADFSQYARFEIEGRHYWQFNPDIKTTMLASRLLVGVGIPYGNSETLPFIKSFFIGGVNSLRGFRARSLGPGTYYIRNFKSDGIIPDQPGDIRIEGNTELRMKLVSVIHGAVFVDGGNIWLLHEDPQRPGGKFGKDWFRQIAVDAGVGIRFDISFLVLRVDLAMPIRKPYLLTGPNWVFDQMDFGSSTWRRENLIINIGIGYPF